MGIILIKPEGSQPKDVANDCIGDRDLVSRLESLQKQSDPVAVGDKSVQAEIDLDMKRIVDKYPQVFQGIGKVKIDPIHIHLKDKKVEPIAEKLRPVALNLMEPLRNHLDELVKGDVIEGPLGLEFPVGWVLNMVIESKKWDPSRIRLTLDTRRMGDLIK